MMIESIGDALAIYFNMVSALWQGMARSGVMQWIIFALAIWRLMGGRGGCRCGCGHCGCWYGRCKYDQVRVEDED